MWFVIGLAAIALGFVIVLLLERYERDPFPEQVPVDESDWCDWQWVG